MSTTTETTTKQNLREFHEMAQHRLVLDYAYLQAGGIEYHSDRFIRESRVITLSVLSFALGNYEIYRPLDESYAGSPDYPPRSCITAPMQCGSMNGIIMYRDREVTAHT